MTALLCWQLAAVVLGGLLVGLNLGVALRDAAAVCRSVQRWRRRTVRPSAPAR